RRRRAPAPTATRPPGAAGPTAAPAAALAAVTGSAERIAKLTGPGSINATDTKWQLKATDLGIMWDNGSGQILTLFGDTFGNGWTGPGGGVGNGATIDWRCNTLVRSADRHLADGMTFDSAVLDRPGHAGTVLPCKQINFDEMTVIPTAAISVGNRQYMHYMSVNHWGDAGRWYTNHSGIAYSDDNGQTWVEDADARWQNTPAWDNRFQMAAMLRQSGHVYLYGTPNGRFGNAYLARVPEGQLLEPGAYRYWNGSAWVTDQWASAVVAAGPVGEVSVLYSRYLGRYVMAYLNESRGALVLRTAPTPTGPWGAEEVVATAAQYPGLYGSYLHPWSADSNSPYLYFTMSQWDPYNVWLMRVKLTGGGMFGGSPTDFTGDGRADIVTFTQDHNGDAYVAPSTGSAFAGGGRWHDWFAPFQETPLTGDFTGDGRDDAVTFTGSPLYDAYVAPSTGSAFGAGVKWHDRLVAGSEVPAVGDVNGDGRDDLVVFSHDGDGDVRVALSNGSSFATTPAKWHEFFAPWGEFPALGDVNGDGRDDLITFTLGGTNDVHVALSTGSSFGPGQKWHDFFGVDGESTRVGDVNGDGRADIVTFTCNAQADVYVALSTGTGFAGTTVRWNDFFCLAGEFPYLGDVNRDGRDDVIVFSQHPTNDVYVGLSTGSGFAGGVKWHDFFGLTGERTF
ncbi:DUF4185 domain-containing protein, partial [Catellatospora sp. NPDC049609]|uniref:DUF4185 domain-containing protein n=1 Tax=Catellatospora sp. NPDC049609 TaxID=3155505 RepID=UPI00341FA5AF